MISCFLLNLLERLFREDRRRIICIWSCIWSRDSGIEKLRIIKKLIYFEIMCAVLFQIIFYFVN